MDKSPSLKFALGVFSIFVLDMRPCGGIISPTDEIRRIEIMAFRQVEDEVYGKAGDAVRAATRPDPDTSHEGRADLVSAAAALVLERAMPNLFAKTHETSADRYLEQGTREWRALHGATARYIDKSINEPEAIKSPGEGVGMIVSDVIQRVSAHKIVNAAGNREIIPLLNEDQAILMHMARQDQRLLLDFSHISTGSVDRISPDMSDSLAEVLGGRLDNGLEHEIDRAARAVDSIVEREKNADQNISRMMMPIEEESFEKIDAFHRYGISTDNMMLDTALDLLSQQHTEPTLDPSYPMSIAQARLYNEGYHSYASSPSELASMAISDAAIIEAARDNYDDLSEDNQLKASGDYHLIETEGETQAIERRILHSLDTPALDKLKLEVMYLNSPFSEEFEHYRNKALDRVAAQASRSPEGPANPVFDEVAKSATAILKKHDNIEDSAFVDIADALDYFHARKPGGDRSLVNSADNLLLRLDDRSMSKSKEFDALSESVEKASAHLAKESAEPAKEASKGPSPLAQQLAAALSQGMGR